MLDSHEEYDKMNQTESQLWWYKNLHDQVLSTLQNKFRSKEISILDAACGTGGLMKRLMNDGFSNVQGFDVSPYAASLAQSKTGKEVNVLNLKEASAFYRPASFDAIICNDALYFIEDTQLPVLLAQLWNLLKPGGVLVINLPAFQMFSGMHDVSVAIKERWTYSKFNKIAKGAFPDALSATHTYWPFLLSPLILSARGWQRLRLKMKPGAEVVSDVELPPLALNKIFYNLTKWESCLPFPKWIGSSLFIVIHR
ncbi:MAG: Methyltransferase type 12 [Cytophagaceae bacterium]|jgi:SAM-dependent methyltransferase|nr:Methyltransferase type 12 [Cytophagaceae bacterium]